MPPIGRFDFTPHALQPTLAFDGSGLEQNGTHVNAQPTFSDHERRFLLSEPRIGPQVVERLEQAGYCSLERLREVGVQQVVLAICSTVGSVSWANRRRPLERALARSVGGSLPTR